MGAAERGELKIWGFGEQQPEVPLVYSAGQTVANGTVVTVGMANGLPVIRLEASRAVHVALDVTGVYASFPATVDVSDGTGDGDGDGSMLRATARRSLKQPVRVDRPRLPRH